SFIGGGGYAGLIPGSMTNRRDVDTATPADLENFWIPLFEQAAKTGVPGYTIALNGLKKSLDQWKTNQGFNNVVNDLPTKDGQVDWTQIDAPTGGPGKDAAPADLDAFFGEK